MILCLAYVVDDGLKAFLVVDIECASTLSPPFLANRRGRGILCGEWTETFLLQRLEPAGASGLELLPDLLGFAVARHDDVHMVRAAIDSVESPPPHPAMGPMPKSGDLLYNCKSKFLKMLRSWISKQDKRFQVRLVRSTSGVQRNTIRFPGKSGLFRLPEVPGPTAFWDRAPRQ